MLAEVYSRFPYLTEEIQQKCEQRLVQEVISSIPISISSPAYPIYPVSLGEIPCCLFRYRDSLAASEYVIRNMIDHPRLEECIGAINLDSELQVIVRSYPITLFNFIRTPNPSKNGIWKYVIQIAEGMQYLHDQNILHRNLNLHQIFMNEHQEIKIGGLHQITSTEQMRPFSYYQPALSRYYLFKNGSIFNYRIAALELFNDLNNASKASDMWAFGVLIWQIYQNGRLPYCTQIVDQSDNLSADNIHRFLIQGLNLELFGPPEFDRLLQDCWHRDPKCRPVFNSEFLDRLRQLESIMETYAVAPEPITSKAESTCQIDPIGRSFASSCQIF